jgi:hypothetical protein
MPPHLTRPTRVSLLAALLTFACVPPDDDAYDESSSGAQDSEDTLDPEPVPLGGSTGIRNCRPSDLNLRPDLQGARSGTNPTSRPPPCSLPRPTAY